MSHLINVVNTQSPDVNGNITSAVSDLKYFFIGNSKAYNFTDISGSNTYPRAIAAGDEYLYLYDTNYYFDNIGVTINNYATKWAESFTIPAGNYICYYSIDANGSSATNVGIRTYLTDGTTRYGGTTSYGRNIYSVYCNERTQAQTRFTLASSTTIYVYIDIETGTATTPIANRSGFCLIKEP